jgi:glycosyltransferase involved in cell wall biosynthesis
MSLAPAGRTVLIDLRSCQINQERGIPAYAINLIDALCRHRPDHRYLFWIDRAHPLPARHAELSRFGQWHDEAALRAPGMLRIDVLLTACVFVDLNRRGRDYLLPPWLLLHLPQTVAIHYDLIPYLFREHYLTKPVPFREYMECVQALRRYDAVFAISRSAREDAIRLAALAPDRVFTLAGDIDGEKRRLASLPPDRERPGRFGLQDRYFVYIGGDDWRKNIVGLVRGFARFEARHRNWQLAVVCRLKPERIAELLALAADEGVPAGRIVFTGMVSDADLIGLVQCAEAMVFPSFYEGLGLPVLEAYACGVPALASDVSSLRELVPQKCRFDPADPASIEAAMARFAADPALRACSIDTGRHVLATLGWDAGGEQVAAVCAADPCGMRAPDRRGERLAVVAGTEVAAATAIAASTRYVVDRFLGDGRITNTPSFPARALLTRRHVTAYRASLFVLDGSENDGDVLRILLDTRGTNTGSRWLVVTAASLRAAWNGYWRSADRAAQFLALHHGDDDLPSSLMPLLRYAGLHGVVVESTALRASLTALSWPLGQRRPAIRVAPSCAAPASTLSFIDTAEKTP